MAPTTPGLVTKPLLIDTLISLQAGTWLVVDRIAPEADCDVVPIHDWHAVCVP